MTDPSKEVQVIHLACAYTTHLGLSICKFVGFCNITPANCFGIFAVIVNFAQVPSLFPKLPACTT